MLEYLPTFSPKITQVQAHIPSMEHMEPTSFCEFLVLMVNFSPFHISLTSLGEISCLRAQTPSDTVFGAGFCGLVTPSQREFGALGDIKITLKHHLSMNHP